MDLSDFDEGSTPGVTTEYISTRGAGGAIGIREALSVGLAPDGGLFVPREFPHFDMQVFGKTLGTSPTLAELAPHVLKPFFDSDSRLAAALPEICAAAFNFPTPLVAVPGRSGDFFLELYHGPTSAFKDVGARFLAGVLTHSSYASASSEKRTVIVATSGDTGGAVAAAFHEKPGTEVVILYPKGMVSPRQEKQLCAWGGNVRAFAVNGTFDDCQRIVKEALQTKDRVWLSANSINLGRILPQMAYYAWASLARAQSNGGKSPGFIVPSGNLGNSLAALWAKKIGFPVGQVVLALNENRGVADYLDTGVFTPAATKPTVANAMDVGNPSNLERLRSLYPVLQDLKRDVSAFSFSNLEISNEIRTSEGEWGQVLCPHSATGTLARKKIGSESSSEWVLVSTAHPAKFDTIIEPLIGREIPLPPALQTVLERSGQSHVISATYVDLKTALLVKKY